MNPIVISSPNDARLDPFRRIKGQSMRADGTFVAESEIVLERLFASNSPVRSVLITPARADRLNELLCAFSGRSVEVFVADREVIDEVVGYPLHRGVIILAERPPLPSVESVLENAQTVLALEQVMDPENVGTAFRHAAGFGVDALLLHGVTGDPLYRKTIRTSMGWSLSIPFAQTPKGSSLCDLLHSAGFTTLALTPASNAKPLAEVIHALDPITRVALLLGAEGPGLENETIAAATYAVRIPMSLGVDSLNVATAAAIALYALTEAQPARLTRAWSTRV